MMPTPRMDEFTQQYFETALWSSSDNSDDSGGEPLDANHSISDIDPKTRDRMIEDCAEFQKDFGHLIDAGGGDYGQAGHDFWLTRNGHGAGFWDGDWPEPQAEELTEASKDFGEYNLYVGDDGVIYGDTSGGYRYNPGYDPRTKKAPSTAREARGRVRASRHVRDYEAIDRQDRVIAGPFKSYGDAKDAAGSAGAVRFVPSRGKPSKATEAPRGVSPLGRKQAILTGDRIEAIEDLQRAVALGDVAVLAKVRAHARRIGVPESTIQSIVSGHSTVTEARETRSAHNPSPTRRQARARKH
jgi:hypothetical protein